MNTISTTSEMDGAINPETGIPPERRFINPKDKSDGDWVFAQIDKFRMCGNTKDLERQEVEAMLRHAPPYNDDDLRALNFENMPNCTMGELPRRVAEEEAKWTDYVVSSSGLWTITFPDLPGQIADAFKEQISEKINTLWMDEARHVIGLQLCFRQFSAYGIGPMVWTDCYDPSPVARIASDLKFPNGTRITLDNFSECALRDSCTAQELYATIKGEVGKARSKLHGWNQAEVMKVLKANATGDAFAMSVWGGTLESVELRERNGENIWDKYQNRDITIVHVFIKEYEADDEGNSISYLTLAQDGTRWRIIRDKGHEYETPAQFLALATDRVGSDMTISGLRGMGVDLLEMCRSMDVMHNASMSAGFRSSIPTFATTGGAGANNADQISIRPNGVIIPMGFTEVQSHVDFQAGGWQIDRLSNLCDRYQRVYDINAPNKGGVQRTAKEAMFDAAKESDARSNQILPIVRLFFEPLGREFTRRLFNFPRDSQGRVLKYRGWKIAKSFWEFIDKLLAEYGAPSEDVLANYRVNINASNTPGGLDKKLMKVEAGMKFYPLLQTQTQRNWLTNNGLTSIFGYQAAKPFLNKDEPLNTNLSIQLDSENADLISGFQRRVYPEQEHLKHLGPLDVKGEGHIPFMMQKLQEIQQGVFEKFTLDPLEALAEQLRGGVMMKGHIDAHLVLMTQNPIIMEMPEVQGYFDFAGQIENILIQSIKVFEKQAMERNPATQGQAPDPKVQALLQKTQAEIEALKAKTQAEIAMAQQKHNVKLGNQVETQQARHDEKNAAFVLDNIIKLKDAQSDAVAKGVEHAIDIKAEKVKLDMQEDAAETQLDITKKKAAAEIKAKSNKPKPAK